MYNPTTGRILGASTVAGASAGALSLLPQTSGLSITTLALYAAVFLTAWGLSYLGIEKALRTINVKRQSN